MMKTIYSDVRALKAAKIKLIFEDGSSKIIVLPACMLQQISLYNSNLQAAYIGKMRKVEHFSFDWSEDHIKDK